MWDMSDMWMQGIVIDIFVWICNGQFNDTTHTLTTVSVTVDTKWREKIFCFWISWAKMRNICFKKYSWKRKETWHLTLATYFLVDWNDICSELYQISEKIKILVLIIEKWTLLDKLFHKRSAGKLGAGQLGLGPTSFFFELFVIGSVGPSTPPPRRAEHEHSMF